jgi:transaldolase
MKLKLNKKTQIFCDGADYEEIIKMSKNPYIKGFTTNPTLMRSSGVINYEKFCKKILKKVNKKSVSFEVFSDDLNEMYDQAIKIASWGKNVYVKIPITNTKGYSCIKLILKLIELKVKINITAVFTLDQIKKISGALNNEDCIVSIFSGRIADTGINPELIVKQAIKLFFKRKKIKVLWASTRELYNIYQAMNSKCHIVTAPISIINKLSLFNKNLKQYSLETIKMFYNDAKKANYKI